MFADLSFRSLLVSNLIAIASAVIFRWSMADLMFLYWGQSVIIGFFQFLKILDLENFSTEGFKINGQPTEPTHSTKVFTAYFFLLHYGFFHFVYLFFIMVKSPDLLGAVPLQIVFLFNHTYSYILNRDRDKLVRKNIGTVMFAPYVRIIPMHLVIGMAQNFTSIIPITLFQVLKTLADLIGHRIDRSLSSPSSTSVQTPQPPAHLS